MNAETEPTPEELRDIELTAYALNELDADRREAVDARLAGDIQLLERLEEIRAGAQGVGAAFAAEQLPAEAGPPAMRPPWVRRGAAVAACLGLAAGSAWVIERGMQPTDSDRSRTIATGPDPAPVSISLPAALPPTDPAVATDSSPDPVASPNKADAKRLVVEARQLQIEMKYAEATEKLDQALFADPDNFSAELLKEVIADAKVSTDYREVIRTRRLSIARAGDAAGQTGVAYRDVQTYPENWPESSGSRVVASDGYSGYDGGSAAAPAGPKSANRLGDDASRDNRAMLETEVVRKPDYFMLRPQHNQIDPSSPSARKLRQQLGIAESYAPLVDNPFRSAVDSPLSTFSIDVDTASYANVRRMLTDGQLPPADAVRIEEFINAFDYGYAPPAPDAEAPFATHVDVASASWAPEHRLVRIGLKGREIATDDRPAANLVFLLDVSGSMNSARKLPLVKDGLRKLVAALRMDDRIAIVVYAGASGLVLDSTTDHDAVLAAIDNLTPGGSTHGSAGIELAYDVATANFIDGGLNRVILCTDGDFNVGITDRSRLKTLIEAKAATGTYLSILGFGSGNLKDATMEELSNAGDGNYGYIDSPREAERLLARQVNGTLLTLAKDVKIQVEFNPARVASYRLIGYANRMLAKEDFNNDRVDAGDIGSGHTVTALYEVVPVGVAGPVPAVDPLRYSPVPGHAPQTEAATPRPAAAGSDELLTVKLRYKTPDAPKEQGTSRLIEVPVTDGGDAYADADADIQFAAAVAGFGMVLRSSDHVGGLDLDRVAELARAANARFAGTADEREARESLVGLVDRAAALTAGRE